MHKKINILFVSLASVIFVFSLYKNVNLEDKFKNFLLSLFFWYWLIYPYTNNKTAHMGAYSFKHDDKFFNKFWRLIFFILGLVCYLKVLYNLM